jgi:hypothetical protein
MWRLTRDLIVALLAGLLGAALGQHWGHLVLPGHARHERQPSPCPELPLAEEEAHRELSELLSLRALRYRLEGPAAEWPEDLPPELAPQAIEAEFARAAEALGDPQVRLLEVDCSEYPCIGLFGAPAPERPSATTTAWSDKLLERMPQLEASFGRSIRSWRLHGEGPPQQVDALAFWVSPAGPELAERVGTRLRQHRILGRPGIRSGP